MYLIFKQDKNSNLLIFFYFFLLTQQYFLWVKWEYIFRSHIKDFFWLALNLIAWTFLLDNFGLARLFLFCISFSGRLYSHDMCLLVAVIYANKSAQLNTRFCIRLYYTPCVLFHFKSSIKCICSENTIKWINKYK